MRTLVLLGIGLLPIATFAIGWYLARMDQRQQHPSKARLELAENLIDDLSVMASEHQQYDDTFAVLAMEKIVEYRRERNQK